MKPLGTHERFIGFLIEHFGGDFPLWLAPLQVVILPISDKYLDYAENIFKRLFDSGLRVKIDDRNEKIGAKIRYSELKKIPVMLLVGEKEKTNKTVSIRRRILGDLGTKNIDALVDELVNEIKTRRRT